MSEAKQQYTMTMYYLCFLKKGPNWTPDPTPEVIAIQEKHLAHLAHMHEMGKLIAAGPGGKDDIRGFSVFCTETQEEAEAIASQDPAVLSGRLVLEFYPWYVAKEVWAEPRK